MPHAQIDLVDLLPAGEWSDIEVLPNPGGMMGNGHRAVFANARWLRQGGKSAFVKLFLPAGDVAGFHTQMIGGRGRLESLAARLERVRQDPAVPVVPLFQVRVVEPFGALLVAMARVEPIQAILESGRLSADLALKVLRELSAPGNSQPWLHFDICPRNVGLCDGRCVLIDVDSIYLEEAGAFPVSYPAWKHFRAPLALIEAVQNALKQGPAFPSEVALKKAHFEIALLAAECAMGPLPGVRRPVLDSDVVAAWADQAGCNPDVVGFWRREFLRAVETGETRSPADLADEFEELVRGRQISPVLVQVPPSTRHEAETPLPRRDAPRAPRVESPAGGAWEREWALLGPTGHALRAGRLGNSEIADYRRSLERLRSEFRDQRALWDELLLVAISYQRDSDGALGIVNEALQSFPGDREYARWLAIIQRWNREQRR